MAASRLSSNFRFASALTEKIVLKIILKFEAKIRDGKLVAIISMIFFKGINQRTLAHILHKTEVTLHS